jgi:large repetitive protein
MRRLIWLALTVVVIGAGCAGNAPLQVATNSLPSAVVQRSYSAKLTAFGGVPPLRWSILSGQLPSGMTLSVDTGNISGPLARTNPTGRA